MLLRKGAKYREYTNFGKAIKKALIDKNMTAAELAGILGIKPQYLNSIIHGVVITEKYKKKICAIKSVANFSTITAPPIKLSIAIFIRKTIHIAEIAHFLQKSAKKVTCICKSHFEVWQHY